MANDTDRIRGGIGGALGRCTGNCGIGRDTETVRPYRHLYVTVGDDQVIRVHRSRSRAVNYIVQRHWLPIQRYRQSMETFGNMKHVAPQLPILRRISPGSVLPVLLSITGRVVIEQ